MPDPDVAAPSLDPSARIPTLSQKLAAAQEAFCAASAEIDRAAAAMRQIGAAPDFRVLHRLGDCHRQFLRLRGEVIAALKAGGQNVPPPDRLADLRALRVLIDGREPVSQSPVAEAVTVPGETSAKPADFAYAATGIEPPVSDYSRVDRLGSAIPKPRSKDTLETQAFVVHAGGEIVASADTAFQPPPREPAESRSDPAATP